MSQVWAPLLLGIVSYYVNANVIDGNILCFDANITFITSKFSHANSTDRPPTFGGVTSGQLGHSWCHPTTQSDICVYTHSVSLISLSLLLRGRWQPLSPPRRQKHVN